MRVLLQRVKQAQVSVAGITISKINLGLLVFLGIDKTDQKQQADLLLNKLLNYRIFSDLNGHMNQSVQQIKGDILLVPQFTLVANTKKGQRPSFSQAAEKEKAEALYIYSLTTLQSMHPATLGGSFGAHMEVSLINDGPATFILET